MKISLSYWCLEGGFGGTKPILKALEEAKSLGFDAIELAIASSGVLTPETTQQECKKIADHAKEIGIEISSLASGESWTTYPLPAARKYVKKSSYSPKKPCKSPTG